MSDSLAPVVLFVYARPEHTLATLRSLQTNPESSATTLYIYSDAAAPSADTQTREAIAEVRTLIGRERWCGEVKVIEAEENKGLARSIIDGVTTVSEKHGRAIVLEDDLQASPGLLGYMNAALDCYQDDPKVMQVSGFNVKTRPWVAKTGFLRASTSWGWATWDRAWQLYDDDARSLLQRVKERGRDAFDLDGYSFHFEELEKNANKELRTWAVRWYASIFLQDGLCLYPHKTLVRNLGFDGTGENCHDDETDYHRRLSVARGVRVDPKPVQEDAAYLNAMQRHYRDLRQLWSRTRLRDRITRKLNQLNPFVRSQTASNHAEPG